MVSIYEKAVEDTFVWNVRECTGTSGIAPNSYEYRQATFKGKAYLKYAYCPVCCTSHVSLTFTQGIIPYADAYLRNMVKTHMDIDGIETELEDMIIAKCGMKGYDWDDEVGEFNKRKAV
jgi:hypothetical protein